MNTRAVCLFVVAFAGVCFAQATASRAGLPAVLDFEEQTSAKLSGWYAYPPETVAADSTVAHSGHWSVRFQRDAKSAGDISVITRKIPADYQGTTLELRAFLRLEQVTGSAHLWMRQDAGGQMLSIANMQSELVNGTHDWAEYRITLPVEAKAQELYFGVFLSGAGTVWADDLQLLVDGKAIAQAPARPVPADNPADHEFDKGSHVEISSLSPIQVENLVTLGRVWGFLKYHHPAVTAGQRNWDYDLLRVLPAVLAAPDRAAANDVVLKWMDGLGPIPPCKPCQPAAEGELNTRPPLDWIHDASSLGRDLSARLEQVYKNRTGHQYYVSVTPMTGNASFDHEPDYSKFPFPDAGFQIVALFRWWNILQYWAPNREVAAQDWPAVLANFVPKMALAPTKEAFQLALFQLIATANDTHANLWSSIPVRPPAGECSVAAIFRFIDNQPVVFRTPTNDGPLRPGDVLTEIDGKPIGSLLEQWSPYYADSNEAARQRDLASALTHGACGPVTLQVKRGGASVPVNGQREHNTATFATHDQPGDTFRLLSPAVAYVKLSTIKAADLAGYFEKAKDTKGMIIDIRNYPSEFMPFAMGQYFASEPTRFVTFTFPDLANPGAFHFGAAGPVITPGSTHYKGRIVILVDEVSQSQAEYTAMAFRAMPHALVVGSTTAGADGDVSRIPLPGGLSTMVTGLGVFYPDHRATQRVGIVPDVMVRPTVEGIAAGKDEVLETAVHLIEANAEP